MDTDPDYPDDLSALQGRLSAWEPSSAGLDADGMLFAAGRDAARPGPARFVWPALACAMTVAVAILGVWLGAERAERQSLARQLRQRSPAPPLDPSPTPDPASLPNEPPTVEEPAPHSFLAAHRALEQGLDAWPVRPMAGAVDTTVPDAPVFRAGQHDILLDP